MVQNRCIKGVDQMSVEMNEHEALNPVCGFGKKRVVVVVKINFVLLCLQELINLTDGIQNMSIKDDARAVINVQMGLNQDWLRITCCCEKSHRVLLTSSNELIYQTTRDNGTVNVEVSQDTIKIVCSCGVGHQVHSSANSKPSYKILKQNR